jgi:type VI secretion system protein ImpB
MPNTPKPAVDLKYNVVKDDGAIEKKDLPFMMGLVGPYSGHRDDGKLSQRRFHEIRKDNFDEVMKAIDPQLTLDVKNKLSDEGEEIQVRLRFESIADFKDPTRIAAQVPGLRHLLEQRERITNALARMDRHDTDELVKELLADPRLSEAGGTTDGGDS